MFKETPPIKPVSPTATNEELIIKVNEIIDVINFMWFPSATAEE
tara:strand:- start:461 stop:592 length:132 start_codon:yes stop_codon:yes gene_type:complete